VLPCTGEPCGDGRVAMPKHPGGSGDRAPFRQGSEHFRNPMGSGFEVVQRRTAAGTEGGATGLAAQGLDPFRFPVGSIADQGVDLRIGDLLVGTGGLGAGKPVRVDALGCAPTTLPFAPWSH